MMLTWGLVVRRQGLEPRTRWLRAHSLSAQLVTNDASLCRFCTSCPGDASGWCRLLSGGVGPLGLVSGTRMPGCVGSSGCRERVVAMTAMATTARGIRPVDAEGVSGDEAAREVQAQRLSRGQTAAVVLSVGLDVVVAGYGLAGSYLSIFGAG